MSTSWPADDLIAEFAEARQEIAEELFADTFRILRITVATDDDHGATVPTWGTVATVRGLLTVRQVTRGERVNGGVVVTESIYEALLPYGTVITTQDRLELVSPARTFAITDVLSTGAVGGPLKAVLQESSR